MVRQIKSSLRKSYDLKASQRDNRTIQPWKLQERHRYLTLLQQEKKQTLLEIGAGTGIDSKYFQEQGLNVTCIDFSPEMIKMCQKKGLTAHVMDVCKLHFSPHSFDAVYSLNCLLHLPQDELSIALHQINAVLKPQGLFYLGVYGGYNYEGIWQDDPYEPQRFFSFHTDEELKKRLAGVFDFISFRHIPFDDGKSGLHFQSCILRKREGEEAV